jgi:hypothetical protein
MFPLRPPVFGCTLGAYLLPGTADFLRLILLFVAGIKRGYTDN